MSAQYGKEQMKEIGRVFTWTILMPQTAKNQTM
jgi:hypothetical protein